MSTPRSLYPHRVLWLVALCLLLPLRPAVAQEEPVSDTLDWRGYYPLEIGNVWEYASSRTAAAYERREVTGDTLLGGTRYFIHEMRT